MQLSPSIDFEHFRNSASGVIEFFFLNFAFINNFVQIQKVREF